MIQLTMQDGEKIYIDPQTIKAIYGCGRNRTAVMTTTDWIVYVRESAELVLDKLKP